jgi:hypothetical protein
LLKKENSTTDFEEFKNQQSKIRSPDIEEISGERYYKLEEKKGVSGSGSGMKRYNSNSLIRTGATNA